MIMIISLCYISYQLGSINNLVIKNIDVRGSGCQNTFYPSTDKRIYQPYITNKQFNI